MHDTTLPGVVTTQLLSYLPLKKGKGKTNQINTLANLLTHEIFVFILAKQFITARAYIIKHKIQNTNY